MKASESPVAAPVRLDGSELESDLIAVHLIVSTKAP